MLPRIYIVYHVNGDKAVQISSDGYNYSDIAMSNNGKYLYCMAAVADNYKVYNESRLVRYNWPSIQGRTLLAPQLDRPINKFVLAGNSVVMSIESEGNDKIYTIPENEIDAKPIIQNVTGCYNNISVSANNIIVANFESAAAPAEVVRINQSAHHLITEFNKAKLDLLDLQPIETFWFTSSKGKKIRSVLVRPAGFDASKKYPLGCINAWWSGRFV